MELNMDKYFRQGWVPVPERMYGKTDRQQESEGTKDRTDAVRFWFLD
jgi:hypothetical protein